ncbi:nucleoside monophosphate kinase [Thermosulfuriphilus sp.]
MRPEALLLLGPTGAGKSPLGDLLAQRGLGGRACHHFDFGEQLRQIASGGQGFSPKERAFVQEVLFEGRLLEDKDWPLAAKILATFLKMVGFGPRDLLVLNGLPRHRGQAEAMEALVKVRTICLLEADFEVVKVRISNNVGGDRHGRCDDQEALVRRKYQTYLSRTRPLVDYYNGRTKLIRLTVGPMTRPEETYEELKRALLEAS